MCKITAHSKVSNFCSACTHILTHTHLHCHSRLANTAPHTVYDDGLCTVVVVVVVVVMAKCKDTATTSSFSGTMR